MTKYDLQNAIKNLDSSETNVGKHPDCKKGLVPVLCGIFSIIIAAGAVLSVNLIKKSPASTKNYDTKALTGDTDYAASPGTDGLASDSDTDTPEAPPAAMPLPQNLGELVASLNLHETLKIISVLEQDNVSDGIITRYYTGRFEVLFNVFTNNSDVPVLASVYDLNASIMQFNAEFGGTPCSFWLTEDGYLCTNILSAALSGSDIMFYIGENAAALVNEIHQTCESTENLTQN